MVHYTKYQRSGLNNKIEPELDPVRSEDGGYSVSTTSVTDFTCYVIASGKTFHLTTLTATNENAGVITLVLYGTAAAASPKTRVRIGGNETVVLTEIEGVKFVYSEAVFAQVIGCDTGAYINVGGKVRDT